MSTEDDKQDGKIAEIFNVLERGLVTGLIINQSRQEEENERRQYACKHSTHTHAHKLSHASTHSHAYTHSQTHMDSYVHAHMHSQTYGQALTHYVYTKKITCLHA